MTTNTCRSCQAQILWAKTTRGRPIPIDAEPHPDGNLSLIDGVAHFGKLAGQARYRSHFASCAQASDWRRDR